jgi:ribosome biogenesis GTPase
LGSSGVGKSTLINWLVGRELQRVQEIRTADDRGKHTTTNRELVLLPQGGLVLDTPGMRELQLWKANDSEGVSRTFEDIETLAEQCRFSDCQHRAEPGCAVQAALVDGTIDEARYQNYEKLRKELRHIELSQDKNAQRVEKDKWKKLTRQAKEQANFKRR